MKRERNFRISFILCFVVLLVVSVTGATAFASSNSYAKFDLAYFENLSREIFGDVKVESSEFIYSLNDEPDYIYVKFSSGYAIYFKDTMELMEYSPSGELPYNIENKRKYYAGPANYYYKENDTFTDAESNDEYFFDEKNKNCLQHNEVNFLYKDSSTAPSVGSSLIPANPPGTNGTNYIPNAQYFTVNPTHGLNISNTCGSVAAQLLLGYNNFYNDRRIISPEHLNGGWNNASGNDDIYDPTNYITPSENPNVCNNPTIINRQIAGTNNNFFDYVISNIQPSGDGSNIGDVHSGLNRILKQRIADDTFEVNIRGKLLSPISSEFIKAEIDDGRPLIIGTSERFGGHDHWVVGYGYQDYTYPVGHSSAGETYSGYIVHYGWTGDYMIWINESWCDSYITLKINHEHDLNIDTENIIGNEKREYRCEECGYRDVKELYELNSDGDTILGCFYEFSGAITIPSYINGVKITKIGEGAFENQTGITNVVLPANLEEIGDNAFKGCAELTDITIPMNVNYIGSGVFAGCDKLNISVRYGNTHYTVQDNVLYDTEKTQIIAAGNINPVYNVPDTVVNIFPYAFYGNGKLSELHIKNLLDVGMCAFENCENLRDVYIYTYELPYLRPNAFAGNSITLYVPQSSQSVYNAAFTGIAERVTSIAVKISFMSDGVNIGELDTYFGAVVGNLITPHKDGYDFYGWYADSDFGGKPISDGDKWNNTEDIRIYAKWTPKKYYISFIPYGGFEFEPKEVTYGEIIGELPVITDIAGHTFNGWKNQYGEYFGEDTVWEKLNNESLIADVTANDYSIKFDGNGGVPNVGNQTVKYGSVINELATAYLDGYTFIGWNTRSDGSGESVQAPFTYLFDGDIELYAQYNANIYNVTFDKQGGSNGDDGVNAVYGAEMPKGLSAPEKVGYEFLGYYALPNGGGAKYYNADMSSARVWDNASDATVFAYWTGKPYTVTLNSDGNGGTVSVTAIYGSAMPTATAPYIGGYEFKGYFAQPDGRGVKYYNGDMSSANIWNIAADTTVYAHFVPNEYVVVFDKQSGENGSDRVYATYNASMPSAKAPHRTGYVFQGYYALPSGYGTKYYNSDMSSANVWDIADGRTLYAYWTGEQYTVTFNKQSGSGGTTSVTVTYGSAMPSASAPTRDGYNFIGYFDGTNGSGSKYYDGQNMTSVKNWDKTYSATLYAYWEQKQYTLTFITYGSQSFTKPLYNGDIVEIDWAPVRSHYEFAGYYDENGNEYIGAKVAQWSNGYYSIAPDNKNKRWNYNKNLTLYARWTYLEINYSYKVSVDEGSVQNGTIYIRSGEELTLNAPAIDGYTFNTWSINGRSYSDGVKYTFELHRSSITGEITIYYNYGGPAAYNDGSLVAFYNKNPSCVATGTLITLADGSVKRVEQLTGNEILLVWNLHTGQFDTAPILFIDKEPLAIYNVINLYFSDGTRVKVIDEHGFWDCDLNKYVYLDCDAAQYIGHWFVKQITDENGNMNQSKVRLVGVEMAEEYTAAWSPVTYGHLCLYVNGMLSMPGGINGMFNIFEVDGDTMRINREAFLRDIEEYGLFTYEEFSESFSLPEVMFEACGGKYLKVALGKELIDVDSLNRLVEKYAVFFE